MRVEVIDDNGEELLLTFIVDGSEYVALPDWVTSVRADGLWQTTCCEMFVAPVGSETYFEFNYSPSTQWAAYQFDGYRTGDAICRWPWCRMSIGVMKNPIIWSKWIRICPIFGRDLC